MEVIPIYQEERLVKILGVLHKEKMISNQRICDMLGISRDTARRDFIKLVEQGAAIRTHGGIALPEFNDKIKAYKERITASTEDKYLIGKTAASYIQKGDLCFLDVSTTVKFLCNHLKTSSTIYTHSLDNAEALSNNNEVDVYLLGGKFNHELWTKEREEDRRYSFGIFLNENDELIGEISLFDVVRGPMMKCILGYCLDEQQNGKGYMTEALHLIMKFAFKEANFQRIEAGVMPHNVGSIRVLEKAGFKKEGYARKNVCINGLGRSSHVLRTS